MRLMVLPFLATGLLAFEWLALSCPATIHTAAAKPRKRHYQHQAHGQHGEASKDRTMPLVPQRSDQLGRFVESVQPAVR